MGDVDSTYLEEFLNSVELLPNDVRRDFELMRDLDRESVELARELADLETAFATRARERTAGRLPTIGMYNGKTSTVAITSSPKPKPPGSAPSPSSSSSSSSFSSSSSSSSSSGPAAVTNVLVGEAYGSDEDSEGGRLMAEIHALRVRINERLTEKGAIATNLCSVLDKVTKKLDTDLAFFETDLRSCGDFSNAAGAAPGSEVAFRPSHSMEDLLLGRVILYHADVGTYDVADIDDSQRYNVPENQVTVLDMLDQSRKLSKGESVYAVYPDTTAFYLATVSVAARRGVAGAEPLVTVQFHGDELDQFGQVPVCTVSLRYVIRA